MSLLFQAALTLALFGVIHAEELKPWPQKFKAPAAKVITSEAPEGVPFAYETANFRLHSDDKIDPTRLAKFATVIESIPLLFKSLPLPLWAPPKGDKPRIILCRDSLSYQSKGGPLGSMGFYDGRRQRILIRADIFLKSPTARPIRLLPGSARPRNEFLGMPELLWRTSPCTWRRTEAFAELTLRTIPEGQECRFTLRSSRLPPGPGNGSTRAVIPRGHPPHANRPLALRRPLLPQL